MIQRSLHNDSGQSWNLDYSTCASAVQHTNPPTLSYFKQKLFATFFLSLNGPRRSYSSSPESAAGQVLTLADLTPAGSEPNLSSRGRRGTPLISSSQPLRSSFPDLRSGSTHLSPRDQEVHRCVTVAS